MNLFKKRISLNEYIDILLEVRLKLENSILQAFSRTFEYQGEKKKLKYEVRIFSLWLITLNHSSKKFRDKVHDTFCEYIGANQEVKNMFYKDIDQRYKNYFTAFNLWQKNPQSGHMIGTTIVEIIKNQNPYFSLEKGPIPSIGSTDALRGFKLFSSAFKLSLKMVDIIKKKIIVEEL